MKLAHVTLIRTSEQPASAIMAFQYQETVPFWKITWAPHHVVFHVDEADENKIVCYRADRVFELVTEDHEK